MESIREKSNIPTMLAYLKKLKKFAIDNPVLNIIMEITASAGAPIASMIVVLMPINTTEAILEKFFILFYP